MTTTAIGTDVTIHRAAARSAALYAQKVTAGIEHTNKDITKSSTRDEAHTMGCASCTHTTTDTSQQRKAKARHDQRPAAADAKLDDLASKHDESIECEQYDTYGEHNVKTQVQLAREFDDPHLVQRETRQLTGVYSVEEA